jgi:outer membrane protein assembly factor BamB
VLSVAAATGPGQPTNTTIVAADMVSGRERWRIVLPDHNLSPVAMVATGETVAAAFLKDGREGDVTLIGLDVGSGDERWRMLFPSAAQLSLFSSFTGSAAGLIVVSFGNKVDGIDPGSGQVVWTFPLSDDAYTTATIAADDRTVLVGSTICTSSCQPTIFVLDPVDGSERWREQLPAAVEDVAVDGDVVYATLRFKHLDSGSSERAAPF